MTCYGLEGIYLEMCNLISGKYVSQYTQLKSGRLPDKGDAVWLVNERGIRTETALKQFLGITPQPTATEQAMLAEILKLKSYYEGGESAPLIEKEEKEETSSPKTLLTIIIVVVILTMVLK